MAWDLLQNLADNLKIRKIETVLVHVPVTGK